MSTWMNVSHCGAHSESLAVTRSSTRIPTIISKSAFCTAFRFQPVPMNPVMCSARGCRTGKGADAQQRGPCRVTLRSASAISSSWPPLRITPWPARMTGRSALDSASAASRTRLRSGSNAGR